jgi:trehalose-phosphatase
MNRDLTSTNEESDAALGQVIAALRQHRPLGLFFDFDGTLAPIVDQPQEAALPETTRKILQRLSELPRVAVGVISSRSLKVLEGKIGLPEISLAGSTGLELNIRGRREIVPDHEALSRQAREIADELEAWVGEFVGVRVERKKLALTLHYRAVALARRDDLLQAFERSFSVRARKWKCVPGPLAIEILPDVAWNKGTAVDVMLDEIRAQSAVEPLCVYAGDHANDAPAFDLVRSCGGLVIGIGPDAPRGATMRMNTSAELQQWLAELYAALTAKTPTEKSGQASRGVLSKSHLEGESNVF